MVRYSTGRKILSVLDDWEWFHLGSRTYVKAVELQKTMDSLLKEEATGGDALRKYARGNVNYDGDELALYVAMQCTPDLSKADCVKCLSKANHKSGNVTAVWKPVTPVILINYRRLPGPSVTFILLHVTNQTD
ncbi:hypothetical protein L1987_47117 [Smallanthus sonchifolius]|uniref:Uncharacterized protein n=1 Tax=Smallanthus sonchifolius TaxID=185202 RepID=A0ACB9G1H1_9ASTR|nr:hypothetical protein L1987_47117 [Smallanthus sonchifolius]